LSKYKIQGIFFDNLSENFEEIINQIIDDSNIDKFKKNEDEIIDMYDKYMIEVFMKTKLISTDKFLDLGFKNNRSIVASNKEAFKYFVSYINCCHTIYSKLIKKTPNKSPFNIDILCISIYGIVVRKSQQIVSLLMDGYIDAAMIIWRTLYENSISFIILMMNKDEELANKFREHAIKNTKKKVDSFTKHHKELGFNPLDEKTNIEVGDRVLSVKNKYGKEFIDNEYGWADGLIDGKGKANLRLLAEICGMDYFRPYYLLCSDHTHSGFDNQNFFKRDGIYQLGAFLSQTADSKKFVDPMQFTVAVLNRVNDHILYNFSVPHEYLINIKLLKNLADNLLKQFDFKKS
jgi:hypothetical protein